ncbi:DUF3152 domain-containing protein [Streptomyces sp. NPDC002463]|uniref:DUF3152 domain-containing protein n=1 Tax=Streptomyces sp. NPDC002463 TaxID=3364645 RepID=UPI00367476B6
MEEGIGLSAGRAAREVYEILADRRSWTADGHNGFELVSSGNRDFVVVIASPATVDRICGAAGLQTRGEVNCDVGHRIGHDHEGCPGPGRPAPAMMQQIDGLNDCKPHAWPYDTRGRYLGDPRVSGAANGSS